jgi:hypothetical protein
MNALVIFEWTINIIAMIGWTVNIKYRLYSMYIFTVASILSIIYFSYTGQLAFLFRSIFYVIVDILAIRKILKGGSK